jgi:hypothetical protein
MDEPDDEKEESRTPALDRRDLMKLGAGVVIGALTGTAASAQGRGGRGEGRQASMPARGSMREAGIPRP